MQMAEEEEDFVIFLEKKQSAKLGVTDEQVDQYPQIVNYSDVLVFAAADACRKGLAGLDGTNLQMMDAIDDGLLLGQLCLFLVKNRIRPMASDLKMIGDMVMEVGRRLANGDLYSVNRRHQLTNNGVLHPTGDDIVPDAVRAEWLGA